MNIYDIAQKAGVSTATVSRVINGNTNVSEKSRKKVQEIMEQEGYVPNAYARRLSSHHFKTVGVICPDISDENHARPVAILERLLTRNGFDFLLSCTETNYGDKTKNLELLMGKQVDAIIVIGSSITELNSTPSFDNVSSKVPIIILNGLIKAKNIYCVLCDEAGAIAERVTNLVERGYREIMYLYDTETYSGYQKLTGYKRGLAASGIPYNPRLVTQFEDEHERSIFGRVYNHTAEAIRQQLPVSAVLAADDVLAVAAQKAFYDAGIRIPAIGFNNTYASLCSTPALSTIDVFMETMCETSINLLLRVLRGEAAAPKIILSSALIERESFRLDETAV